MKHFSSASFLDRAILSVSPLRGLARIEAKARANTLLASSAVMNYDAGSNGRRLRAWRTPGTNADAAAATSRATMRNRSRDMIRNAPFARRAMAVVSGNVVGSGIMPAITGGGKAKRAAAEKRILAHLNSPLLDSAGALNLDAMQTVVCNSIFTDGEVLAVRRMLTPVEARATGRSLPFSIELIEVDHLNASIVSHDGNEVIDGVEFSASGVVVAYHLFLQHPGSLSRKVSMDTRRIPAADVLHIRRIDRPGQVRGVPWLAPVMLTLGELRDYQEAQILKQKISALLAGVVKTPEGAKRPPDALGLSEISPGAIVHAGNGEEVSFTSPPQVNDYEVVMRLGLMAIAMGIGITYESLSGDLSRVNFSSMRAGRLEMDRNIEAWQSQVLIAQFCEGVARWCLDAYRIAPGVRSGAADGLAINWTAQRRALIDPTKEIPAILKKVEGGLSSLGREQRALGLDPEVIAKERADDLNRLTPLAEALVEVEAAGVGASAMVALMRAVAAVVPKAKKQNKEALDAGID